MEDCSVQNRSLSTEAVEIARTYNMIAIAIGLLSNTVVQQLKSWNRGWRVPAGWCASSEMLVSCRCKEKVAYNATAIEVPMYAWTVHAERCNSQRFLFDDIYRDIYIYISLNGTVGALEGVEEMLSPPRGVLNLICQHPLNEKSSESESKQLCRLYVDRGKLT